MLYPILLVFFFLGMLLYFKIADHYNIIDHPNERSSHSEITIRGGGIVFLFAAMISLIVYPEYWLPILGLFIVGIISFIDDRITLSGRLRLIFHLIAVTLMFSFLGVFTLFPWWLTAGLYIFVIGIINAYNFMDGINGITGLYSLVVLSGLQYVNHSVSSFIEPDLIWFPILASLVFLYFNFRKKAKCFAGDVGSVSIAFWIIFLLLKLIMLTHNFSYILFLGVYGVDTVLTIIHRLKLRHNIFEAHRLHFYQILANEQGWSHLWVSSIYAGLQLGIIVAVVCLPVNFGLMFLMMTAPLIGIYLLFKPKILVKAD